MDCRIGWYVLRLRLVHSGPNANPGEEICGQNFELKHFSCETGCAFRKQNVDSRHSDGFGSNRFVGLGLNWPNFG